MATQKTTTTNSGLSSVQARTLRALKGTSKSKTLTRKQLAAKTGKKKGWARLLGAASKGKPAKGTMEGNGLVASVREGRTFSYFITPAGTKALAEHEKAQS